MSSKTTESGLYPHLSDIELSSVNESFNPNKFDESEEKSAPNIEIRKFLVLPSLFSGIFLGINNFLLGLISTLGVEAAYIFSIGALVYTLSIKLYYVLKNKYKNGKFVDFEKSNLIKVSKNGTLSPNYINVIGLLIRTAINIGF